MGTTEAALAGGVVGGLFAFLLTFSLIYYILLIIAGWKVFEKAGEKGWKTLIPIYNYYIFYKIVGMKNWFWALFIASIVISVLTASTGQSTQTLDFSTGAGVFAGILMIALTIFAIIASIIYAMRTSKAFGHGIAFAVGIFFLSGIFLLILGFGKSKYNKKIVSSWDKE